MKTSALRKTTLTIAFAFLLLMQSKAQDLSTAVAYMSYMTEKMNTINKTYMAYLSAVSHGKSARKVDKLRLKTVNLIFDTRMDIMGTPPFKGDKALRDATVAYLKTCHSVFNEDYGKIVDMEEIAEQSYDGMEAYLLAQEKAGEKLKEAADKRRLAGEQFASANNIKLIDNKDELDLKLEKADEVNHYYNKIFLIFFKSHKQEAYVTQAVNMLDINGVEQNRNSLLNYSTAGLQELSAINAYRSDASLVTAAKKVLMFYKEMAEKKVEHYTNFLLAEDAFKKAKKAFESTPPAKRTQADVDAYNKAVADMNKNSNNYNKMNNEINKERAALLNLWNTTVKNFMDTHIPYAK